jgi:hypothetical protein
MTKEISEQSIIHFQQLMFNVHSSSLFVIQPILSSTDTKVSFSVNVDEFKNINPFSKTDGVCSSIGRNRKIE